MARVTKKEIATQNEALLQDAKERMSVAQNRLTEARDAVRSAEAVSNHATEAYYAIEERLNPPKAGRAQLAKTTK